MVNPGFEPRSPNNIGFQVQCIAFQFELLWLYDFSVKIVGAMVLLLVYYNNTGGPKTYIWPHSISIS